MPFRGFQVVSFLALGSWLASFTQSGVRAMSLNRSLLHECPEPEPQCAGEEEAEAPSPLDTPQLVFISADGGAGDLTSFRRAAEMLRAGQITGDCRVFVPPAVLEAAQAVMQLVDMESVEEMDGDDVEELARSLREQLTPKEAVDMSGDMQQTMGRFKELENIYNKNCLLSPRETVCYDHHMSDFL